MDPLWFPFPTDNRQSSQIALSRTSSIKQNAKLAEGILADLFQPLLQFLSRFASRGSVIELSRKLWSEMYGWLSDRVWSNTAKHGRAEESKQSDTSLKRFEVESDGLHLKRSSQRFSTERYGCDF